MNSKLIVLAATAVSALMLASCDSGSPSQQTYAEEAPVEEPIAPAAQDSAEPVVAPDVVDPVPQTQTERLPPEERTSEESVQPDSETLFY